MHIVAAGSYAARATDDLPALKSTAREATGTSSRRTSRFVQLALIGAGRCVQGRTLPADTATYFASGRGDLEVTVTLLRQLYERGLTPSPFDFINTVGSSVGFHVAKSFGLAGRSQFVTRRHAPLESALRLAALDMLEGGVRTALVGAADMCTTPLAAHRARIGVDPGTVVGEGSHWFLLSAECDENAALGRVRSVRVLADDAELREHLKALSIDRQDSVLAPGPNLPPDRIRSLSEATGIRGALTDGTDLPWHDSRAGQSLHTFLTLPPARTLVHMDGDPGGRLTVLVVDATRPAAPDPKPTPRAPRTDR